eukprot:7571953-Ditylum_brightwellii.AAC.1
MVQKGDWSKALLPPYSLPSFLCSDCSSLSHLKSNSKQTHNTLLCTDVIGVKHFFLLILTLPFFVVIAPLF